MEIAISILLFVLFFGMLAISYFLGKDKGISNAREAGKEAEIVFLEKEKEIDQATEKAVKNIDNYEKKDFTRDAIEEFLKRKDKWHQN